jgi:hypothetical protein
MLRILIWGAGMALALCAGNLIADACEALDDCLCGELPGGRKPPGPPQPARVRVIILVPEGEAPGGEEPA